MTPQEILEQFGPRESMEYDVVIRSEEHTSELQSH